MKRERSASVPKMRVRRKENEKNKRSDEESTKKIRDGTRNPLPIKRGDQEESEKKTDTGIQKKKQKIA